MQLRCPCLLRLTLPAFLSIPLFAQTVQPPAPTDSEVPAATFHVNARTVVIDVVVTDKQNKAATSLQKGDFQVSEDGKPQAITFFEYHAGESGTASAQLTPHLPADTFTNVPATPPADSVNVLLMDALNTPLPDQVYVHKQMVKYLATLRPGIRIGVFLLGNRLRIVQGFTEDSSLLRKAIARSAANPAMSALLPNSAESNMNETAVQQDSSMGLVGSVEAAAGLQQFLDQQTSFQANERIEMTLDALQQIARYLGGIPGRKNLIWFTGSIPLTFFATAEGNVAGAGTSNPNGDSPYAEKVKNTVNILAKAQVSVYPIEAGGLAPDPITDASTPPITATISSGAPGTFDLGQRASQYQTDTLQAGTRDRNFNHLAMEEVARDTGGKASYNQNGLNQILAEDIENGSRYYTIAYTPTNLREEGRERRVEVKVVPGRYNLNYRRNYFEDSRKDLKAAEAAKVKDPLRPLMDRGMPNFTELHYRMSVTPANPQPAADAARAGSNSALKAPLTRFGIDFVLAIDGLDLATTPEGLRQGKIEVAMVAYSHDGKPLNWIVHFVGLSVRPEQYESAQKSGIPFHLDIDVPPGDVYLRSGIFDTSSSKAGTLEIPLSAVTVAAK